MIEVENYTVKYFRAPKDHFWHWTDNGTVIEWANGETICYREDLLNLLQQVNSGLPPLSPLLLLLTACARPLHIQDKFFLMREANEFTGHNKDNPLHKTLEYALKFLAIVAELPVNLRTGQKRIQLIYEVFSGATFTFDNSRLRDAIIELNSGRMDKNVFHYFSEKIAAGDFINCLLYFCTALQKFPSVQSLIIKLRTGLNQLPEAAPVILPESNLGSLYHQLLQDPETAGIARLTKRLTSALKIPMQSKGSSDQPFGGISDITNRGNYDKLLLSELAYDDELLMARLVNNEALYFRREEPPENPKMQRIILMDTTLKMWGTSRIFALAAGLASAQQNKHSELLQAYTLGADKYTPVSLASKHGVVQALEMLDPALHCGMALEAVINATPVSAMNEFIFITHARLLHNPAFYVYLAKVKQMLSFIITVTDVGEIQLYEIINGISKLISTAKIDVDALLAEPSIPKAKIEGNNITEPAFLSQQPSPLFFPVFRVKLTPEKLLVKERFGAVMVNETQRVLFVNQAGKAAIELMSYIEKGDYSFGFDSNHEINILVSNQQRNLCKFYKISTGTFEVLVTDLSHEMQFARKAVFKDDKFYIQTNYRDYIYDCIAGIVVDKKECNELNPIIDSVLFSSIEFRKLITVSKYPIYNESIFYHVKNININENGLLVVGKHMLLAQNGTICLKEDSLRRTKGTEAKSATDNQNLLKNKNLRFIEWKWDDGSEAIVDPRGFLHLRSSNESLPEITIVMVLERVTACWASDNSACGSPFYINEKIVNYKTADVFYNEYIQKFINQLI